MARMPRNRNANGVPVPPGWFDVDADVYALYAEMTDAPDANERRQLADRVAEWAATHSVDLYPQWGAKITARWIYDDETGRVLRHLAHLSGRRP